MPLELGKDPNQHWYFLRDNEFKPVSLFCPWTVKTPTEQVELTITRIDFTFQRQFWLHVQVHPTGDPLLSKDITLMGFHEHFASAIAAIPNHNNFPEICLAGSDLTVIESLLTDPVVNRYTWTTSSFF